MNNKAYIPPLAFAILMLLAVVVVVSSLPSVKATLIEILNAVFN